MAHPTSNKPATISVSQATVCDISLSDSLHAAAHSRGRVEPAISTLVTCCAKTGRRKILPSLRVFHKQGTTRSRLSHSTNRGIPSCRRSRAAPLRARHTRPFRWNASNSRSPSPWPWPFPRSASRPRTRRTRRRINRKRSPSRARASCGATTTPTARFRRIDRSAFEQQNSIALETALNELPQFVPAAQGMTQLQDQSQITDNFATLTAGASTISLRGLGANRNLVLLDGYRAMPVNATMAVDVNSIPAAAIERVEVITGGASSVYGADAVAGVVNFILKKDFEGLDLDIQTGSMQNGEGAETRASALFGVSSGRRPRQHHGGHGAGAGATPIHADDTDFWTHALRDGTTYPHAAHLHGPVFHHRRGQRADSRRRRSDLQPGAGAVGVVAGGRRRADRRRRQFLLERGRHAVHGRCVVQQQHVPGRCGSTAGAYRYNGPTYTSRTNANVPGDYPFRYINNEGAIDQHISAVRSQHSARSQLRVRPRHVQLDGQHRSVRAGVERLIGDATVFHGLARHRRLGQHRAARQRHLRAVA